MSSTIQIVQEQEQISWTQFKWSQWQMYIAATSHGLCYVNTPDASFDIMSSWLQRHYPKHRIVQNDEGLTLYVEQLTQYFEGNRKEFELTLDLSSGTKFQQSVWAELGKLPHGSTHTYSDLANSIGRPTASRAVGAAIGANPLLIVVPCHRVIGKSGALTGYRAGMPVKTKLLQLEGSL